MVQLKTGKMSTREGNIIKLEDLLNEAIEKSKKIIEEKIQTWKIKKKLQNGRRWSSNIQRFIEQ